jgi:hypothetical protein
MPRQINRQPASRINTVLILVMKSRRVVFGESGLRGLDLASFEIALLSISSSSTVRRAKRHFVLSTGPGGLAKGVYGFVSFGLLVPLSFFPEEEPYAETDCAEDNMLGYCSILFGQKNETGEFLIHTRCKANDTDYHADNNLSRFR